MPSGIRRALIGPLAALLCLFTLVEVNYPHLAPQSQLALFAFFGLALCFLFFPSKLRGGPILDGLLVFAAALCCLYIVVQTEPAFEGWWLEGRSLGDRAGAETGADVIIGVVGLVVVLEATRRTVGLPLPLLSVAFLLYGFGGAFLPGWLLPHRGYSLERIVAQAFLQGQGVFGIALNVMFTYVFLFVVFGAVLEATGATGFFIGYAQRLFHRSVGAPAKVAVLASGLLGSLSGSAVANTATTGTFTIPLMRSSGFRPHLAAGIEAAASSGGALVPPVMGAGAYMMLEIVQPPVTYLQIVRAALIPALLYYLSLFLFVHFYARRIGGSEPARAALDPSGPRGFRYEGVLLIGSLVSLLAFLFAGYTVFRAVSLSLGVVVVASAFHPRTRVTPARARESAVSAARGGVPLVAAGACVGIILGIVILTGAGTKLPSIILPLADQSVLLALILIMISSLVLGMGLPSAVCYLLLATLVGPVLAHLGVVPLAAHFFIFYFGMMSMVTPPVALAAYTAASIAGSDILASSLAAFRVALVGFTLPFMFVFRPELLLLSPPGTELSWAATVYAVVIAAVGILALAAGLAGYLWTPLRRGERALLFLSAALLLYPGQDSILTGTRLTIFDLAGVLVFGSLVMMQWARRAAAQVTTAEVGKD